MKNEHRSLARKLGGRPAPRLVIPTKERTAGVAKGKIKRSFRNLITQKLREGGWDRVNPGICKSASFLSTDGMITNLEGKRKENFLNVSAWGDEKSLRGRRWG